ncbi:MAG: hypothetical protein ACTMUB_00175 [cyanobacterium endosymbiont of Rhopalodia musculus]|uniref:hypothetical protein n=1 Tax=cyanobacterium endosymbiont of Epithemia clementina EcSB TaxID=3034674 RepID=UPI0024815FAA|nr:hypothetical protein [cyanobacterium endosymbiont of Epithemia clementina EcSB]WGT66709.1 hypothetical protein P3F56_05415 [cyanobacterium endosymbiont of Epithemia clementina EcSB]
MQSAINNHQNLTQVVLKVQPLTMGKLLNPNPVVTPNNKGIPTMPKQEDVL